MALNKLETGQLKDEIITAFKSMNAPGRDSTTIGCQEGSPIWKNSETGKTFYGCGEVLVQFTIEEEDDNMWSIAADLYIVHLNRRHELNVDFGI